MLMNLFFQIIEKCTIPISINNQCIIYTSYKINSSLNLLCTKTMITYFILMSKLWLHILFICQNYDYIFYSYLKTMITYFIHMSKLWLHILFICTKLWLHILFLCQKLWFTYFIHMSKLWLHILFICQNYDYTEKHYWVRATHLTE